MGVRFIPLLGGAVPKRASGPSLSPRSRPRPRVPDDEQSAGNLYRRKKYVKGRRLPRKQREGRERSTHDARDYVRPAITAASRPASPARPQAGDT